jgi:subfamily B ATP-binding cassette protein MsbA
VGLGSAEERRTDAATSALRAFERTRRALRKAADDPALVPTDAAAWSQLARGARLQASAEAMVQPTAGRGVDLQGLASAVQVSIEARRAAWDVSFAHAFATLKRILAWALGLALLIAAGHYATFYLARKLTAILYVDLQRRLADHLLGLSLRFFEAERRGDLLSRLTTDLGLVANVITSQCDLVVQLIRLAVLSAVALWTSLPLALVLFAGAVFVVLPLRRWGRKQRRASRRRQGAAGDVFESVQQMVSGVRVVKGFQREAHELARFDRRVEETTVAQIEAVRTREAAKSFMQLVNDLAVPALFLLGAVVVVERWWDLDAGTFGSFLGLILLMYLPARAVGEAWTTFNDALPSVDRVFQLLDVKPEVVDAKDAVAAPPLEQAVTFEDVTFNYGPKRSEDDPDTLSKINFTAPAGTMTALVGATGAGKSTLVDLLCRIHDPTGGRILVDGVDLRRIRLADWLDRLAVVPQQGFLFNDTIRENIRYGRLDATREDIDEAARLAELTERELVDRFDAPVGDRGSRLSGGQVQRLALARAIVKGPKLLILDEATSKLDAKTERLVQQALKNVAARTTTFVVAHRLSTIREAHQILVLDEGRIVQRGTHADLERVAGPYADLLRDQAFDRPDPAEVQSSGTT